MFIHVRSSATKRFIKLEGKNEIFVGKKKKRQLAQPRQTDYSRWFSMDTGQPCFNPYAAGN